MLAPKAPYALFRPVQKRNFSAVKQGLVFIQSPFRQSAS